MRRRLIPYVNEYSSGRLFWGAAPGSFVAEFYQLIKPSGTVLDAGAGDGKNTCFLASQGFDVLAVEPSRQALKNMELNPLFRGERINRVQALAEHITPRLASLDAVIAYGLLHCFPTWEQGLSLVPRWISATRPGGIHIIASIVDDYPIDLTAHPYLSQRGLPPAEAILDAYSSGRVLASRHGLITETHPTTNVEHQHSIFRMAVQL